MSLTVRVRTTAKMVRVTVPKSSSVNRLKDEIETLVGIPASEQILSMDPAGREPLSSSSSLSSFRNGQIVHLKNPVSASAGASAGAGAGAGASSLSKSGRIVLQKGRIVHVDDSKTDEGGSSSREPRELTKWCQHGPSGACHHCCPPDPDATSKEPLNKAFRYTSRHMDKSTGEGVTGDMEWLCSHPMHQMCTNCAPLREGEKVELEMLCQHPPTGQCVNCLPDDIVENKKHVTYDQFIADRKAKCEHSFSASCVNCMPPSEVSYTVKPGCTKHKPWPLGLCNECQPPPAALNHQRYRHVDVVEVRNLKEMERFVALWTAGSYCQQRVGFLYGRVEPDPRYTMGKRAVVEAVYEPPQTTGMEGAEVLTDPKARAVAAIAGALGLTCVGWMFTYFPREYLLSSHELRKMARLQLAHAEPGSSRSTFVTVTITANDSGGVEPKGYQAADTLLALERDNVLGESKEPEKFQVREPGPREVVPDVIVNSKKTGSKIVTDFDVEFMMVQLNDVGTVADAKAPLLKHSEFVVENRAEHGQEQSRAALKAYLDAHRSEPWSQKLSDFHVLVYLAEILSLEDAVTAAECVKTGSPLPEGLALLLDNIA